MLLSIFWPSTTHFRVATNPFKTAVLYYVSELKLQSQNFFPIIDGVQSVSWQPFFEIKLVVVAWVVCAWGQTIILVPLVHDPALREKLTFIGILTSPFLKEFCFPFLNDLFWRPNILVLFVGI